MTGNRLDAEAVPGQYLGGRIWASTALAVYLVIALAASAASAFQINPLKNKYRGNSPQGTFAESITQSVHEDITDAAVLCEKYWSRLDPGIQRPPCRSLAAPPLRPDHGNKADPLMRGLWWNDDPNQLLWRWDYPTWLVWMRDAHKIATKGRNWLGQRTRINATYKMQYRSHYGDLQFLHAMASDDGESADEVRARILLWIRFAYQVAIDDINISTKLGDLDDELTRTYFIHQPGWTVNYLFGPKYRWNAETMPEVALGSILHIVQDSFSEAHVQRSYVPSTVCPAGGVLEFHAYGGQDPDAHGRADTRRALVGNTGFSDGLSPVDTSATMLVFAHSRADWSTVVEPYLKTVLFCLEPTATQSGPGSF